MERIAQVEQKIMADNDGNKEAIEKIMWPSQYLMKNYSPLDIAADNQDTILKDLPVLDHVLSPDVSDLQKRFELLREVSLEESEAEENEDNEVVLPENLQKLVDKAMAAQQSE